MKMKIVTFDPFNFLFSCEFENGEKIEVPLRTFRMRGFDLPISSGDIFEIQPNDHDFPFTYRIINVSGKTEVKSK